jgi:hypothetical protein
MGRSKEYIPVRYDDGTVDRVDGLRDYVGVHCFRKARATGDVNRSEVLRELVDFALTIYERRAETWRAEVEAAPSLDKPLTERNTSVTR